MLAVNNMQILQYRILKLPLYSSLVIMGHPSGASQQDDLVFVMDREYSRGTKQVLILSLKKYKMDWD